MIDENENQRSHMAIGFLYFKSTFQLGMAGGWVSRKTILSSSSDYIIIIFFLQFIVQLRKHMAEIALEQPYMGEEVPIRWLQFEGNLAEMAAEKTHYISFKQVNNVCKCNNSTTFYYIDYILFSNFGIV